MIKYKPVYKVIISGEEVGYIINKDEFEKIVNDQIINPLSENIAYVEIQEMPTYELSLADIDNTNEQEIFNKIQESATITYKLYAITVNGENAAYVDTKQEAEQTVAKIKEEYKNNLKQIDIMVTEEYTKDKNTMNLVQTQETIEVAESEVLQKMQEQRKIINSTLNGVYFAVTPITGPITSRYGAEENIRDHAHKGIDIAAPNGTDIKAAAVGTVSYSGWMNGYGNLIIINHKNGIQTYYGHCSKLYACVGDEVEAGDVIAAVGSTGFSTGNHLHFEIRKNGTQINPQTYVYNNR